MMLILKSKENPFININMVYEDSYHGELNNMRP